MIEVNGSNIDLDKVHSVAFKKQGVTLGSRTIKNIQASRDYIEKKLKGDEAIYGVNTGFGAFSSVKISNADLSQLQVNLIRSHACGVGEPLSIEESRAILVLRANTLARGTSGIRVEVVEKVLEFINKDIIPVIPSQGSVGASGDLAPMAHIALALIGEGKVWDDGQQVDTKLVLQKKEVRPVELQPKEGLSLINGCQVMTAIGMLALAKARNVSYALDIAGAMSTEALRGSRSPFLPIISLHRPHYGEAETARNLLKLLGKKSEISESHIDCEKVQDAYSVRCMPAVHGTFKSAWNSCLKTLNIEANASTDNPLVFHEEDLIVSCGNFHGQPVATALDQFAIAATAAISISEQRIEKLINPSMSDLPAFLTPQGGLNSGFMMAHVTAAALVSESKVMSHPASVDSLSTSADKEDHVSMGTIAARKLVKIIEFFENVVAIELLVAKQGLHLLKPLRTNELLAKLEDYLHSIVPPMDQDRYLAPDIEAMKNVIVSGELYENFEKIFQSDLEI